MKTLEHEIRDVLNNKINLYDETLLEELALELYESGDINFDDENEDEYLTEALPLVPIIVGAARLGLSTAGKQFIRGLIKEDYLLPQMEVLLVGVLLDLQGELEEKQKITVPVVEKAKLQL
jgi:GTP-sensing pleiotropic transcriptional regulator CodY